MIGHDNEGNLFVGHYVKWRENRIRKIEEVMGGKEWFRDKRILELGCGWGAIGFHFKELGANVVFCDVREEHIEKIRSKSANTIAYVVDQDGPWEIPQKNFDLIIHSGVLYHLYNWKLDLKSAFKHGDTMILETVVADNEANDVEIEYEEPNGWDQSPHKYSLRPTAAYIEKCLTEMGYKFERFDDGTLNADKHKYDWKVSNYHIDGVPWTMSPNGITRRFWKVERDNQQDKQIHISQE